MKDWGLVQALRPRYLQLQNDWTSKISLSFLCSTFLWLISWRTACSNTILVQFSCATEMTPMNTKEKSLGLSIQSLSVSLSACKSANIDLVLLIDGSKSVRPQNFELVKKFVNQVRQRYHTLMYYVYLKNLKICINTNKKLLHRWDVWMHPPAAHLITGWSVNGSQHRFMKWWVFVCLLFDVDLLHTFKDI